MRRGVCPRTVYRGHTHRNCMMTDPVVETALLILYWFSETFKGDQQLHHLLNKIKWKNTVFSGRFPGSVRGAFLRNDSWTPRSPSAAREESGSGRP